MKTLVFLPDSGNEGRKLARELTEEYEHNAVLALLRKHNLELLASLLQNQKSGVVFVRGDTGTNVAWLYQYLTEAVSLSLKRPPDHRNEFGEVRVVTHELAAKGYYYCVRNSAYVEVKADAETNSADSSGGDTKRVPTPTADGTTYDFGEDMYEKDDAESFDTFISHSSDQATVRLLLQNECALDTAITSHPSRRGRNSLARTSTVSVTPGERAATSRTLWLVPYFLSGCDAFLSLVHLWKVPPESGRVQFLLFLNTDIVDDVLLNLQPPSGTPPPLLRTTVGCKNKKRNSLSDATNGGANDYITMTELRWLLPIGATVDARKRKSPSYTMETRRLMWASYSDFRRNIQLFLSSRCCAYQHRLGAGEGGSESPVGKPYIKWRPTADQVSPPKMEESSFLSVPTLMLFSRGGVPADTADLLRRVEGGTDNINNLNKKAFFAGQSKRGITTAEASGESSCCLRLSDWLNKEVEGVESKPPGSSAVTLDRGSKDARFHPALVATEGDVRRSNLSSYLHNRSAARTLIQMRQLKLQQLQQGHEEGETHISQKESLSTFFPTPRVYAPNLFSAGALLSQEACVSDVYVLEFSPHLFQDLYEAYEKQAGPIHGFQGGTCQQPRVLSPTNTALENLRLVLEAL